MTAIALATARKLISDFNRHDAEAVASHYAPNAVQATVGSQKLQGRQAIQAYFTAFFSAFPDLRLEVRRTFLISATSAAVEYVLTGTHLGPLEFMGQTVPATGRTIKIPYINSATVNAEGLISAATVTGNLFDLALQLGLAPLQTTEDQRIAAVRKLYKSAAGGDLEGIMACYSPLAQFGDATTGILDREQIRTLWATRLKAFPNGFKVAELEIGIDGPAVLARVLIDGVQSGSLADGTSTGKSISVEAMEVFEVGTAGIMAHRSYLDEATLLKQLGLLK